jgi:hypothetical protein
MRFTNLSMMVLLLFGEIPADYAHAQSDASDKVIGHITWSIQDTATDAIIAKGDTVVRLKDVVLHDMTVAHGERAAAINRPSGIQKSIRLNDQFTLAMPEYPSKNRRDKEGFGMTVNRTDIRTFNWEWFQVRTDHRAAKIQESGELGIDLLPVGSAWEVTRTEFLTDISFRVSRPRIDPEGHPRWRVFVIKGSTITWPSLINGEVVSN